jgi:molecular chaperone DnaK (HSP70)
MGNSEPMRRMHGRQPGSSQSTQAVTATQITAGTRQRRTVGIDLGSANSVIAVLQDGKQLVTGSDPLGRSGPLYPSVVGWDDQNEQFRSGPDARLLSPSLHSIKELLGQPRHLEVGPRGLSPVEVTSLLLNGLRTWMMHTLQPWEGELDQAVITIPTYFGVRQIEALRQACELASFKVVEILPEPAAAALYASWRFQQSSATYLVCDVGASSVQLALVQTQFDEPSVLSCHSVASLGGNAIDRLLAGHVLKTGLWKWQDGSYAEQVDVLFAPGSGEASIAGQRMVRIAESIKKDLSRTQQATRYIPCFWQDRDSRQLSLEITVSRQELETLLGDALKQLSEGIEKLLSEVRNHSSIKKIDGIVLVGGGCQIPSVRRVVEAAVSHYSNRTMQSSAVIRHEPELCVAYGTALRAARYGIRHAFALSEGSLRMPAELELQLSSPVYTQNTQYTAYGSVRVRGVPETFLDGASVCIRSRVTGLVEEAFLDADGRFSQHNELQAETSNQLEWTVVDAEGRVRGQARSTVEHWTENPGRTGESIGKVILGEPLSIEVLTPTGQRSRKIVMPAGTILPSRFEMRCRTSDQVGRIVVPVCEGNRLVRRMVIRNVARTLPVGTVVCIEGKIDEEKVLTLIVRVGAEKTGAIRTETTTIELIPVLRMPTRGEIEEVLIGLEKTAESLQDRLRTRFLEQGQHLYQNLLEALNSGDELRAIEYLNELRTVRHQSEQMEWQGINPPWNQFVRLVRDTSSLAHGVARQTGRDIEELLTHIQTQERYAEQAYEACNQKLYQECWENLESYASYLHQLLLDSVPGGLAIPTHLSIEAVRSEVEAFRTELQAVWKNVRANGRTELEPQLANIARQGGTLLQRLRIDPLSARRDARRLHQEVKQIKAKLERDAASDMDTEGFLSAE